MKSGLITKLELKGEAFVGAGSQNSYSFDQYASGGYHRLHKQDNRAL